MLTFAAKKRNFWLIFKDVGALIQPENVFVVSVYDILVLNVLKEEKRLKQVILDLSHLPFQCPVNGGVILLKGHDRSSPPRVPLASQRSATQWTAAGDQM